MRDLCLFVRRWDQVPGLRGYAQNMCHQGCPQRALVGRSICRPDLPPESSSDFQRDQPDCQIDQPVRSRCCTPFRAEDHLRSGRRERSVSNRIGKSADQVIGIPCDVPSCHRLPGVGMIHPPIENRASTSFYTMYCRFRPLRRHHLQRHYRCPSSLFSCCVHSYQRALIRHSTNGMAAPDGAAIPNHGERFSGERRILLRSGHMLGECHPS